MSWPLCAGALMLPVTSEMLPVTSEIFISPNARGCFAPRWPFATLAARSTLAISTCPRGRRGQGTMLNHRVGRRVSVSQEDQFQRNGVILDQHSLVWNDDTGAVSRGGAGRLYWHL